MRAVQVKEFGGPEVLMPVELPDPEPEAGEVVIDVAYADTLFVETQVRSGWGREYFDVTPPYVPGGGVSGTVTETGPGGVAGTAGDVPCPGQLRVTGCGSGLGVDGRTGGCGSADRRSAGA
ncbi:hypothetical protein ACWCQ1_38570 [Streptomyces sp. NPDC002144]